ncbi:M20 family metallopeptidase [candidate division KSB1 bacterium]
MKKSYKNLILEAAAKDQAKILEFTKKLTAIATENPPGSFYKECINSIAAELSDLGLDYEIIEIPDQNSDQEIKCLPRYCLTSSYGKGEKTFYFHGHYDVVPASRKEQFNPVIKNGCLFGRGASDMKSGLAAMIYAVKAIKTSNIDLNGKIGLVIVPDEETGGTLGSKYLSDKNILGKNAIGMLTAEPTSGVIWNANRGAVSLRVIVKGKPAHVGLQYEGINAFENMVDVVKALQELKKEVVSRITKFNIYQEQAKRSILMLGGRCDGGTSFNLVPGECSFTVDRRINPEEDLEEEKHRLINTIEACEKNGIDLEIEMLQEGESAGSPENSPIAHALVKNIKEVTGKKPVFEMCPGLLETRFYAKKGIPAFAYGPGILSVSHGPDEFVKISDIYKCTSIYALTALDVLSD